MKHSLYKRSLSLVLCLLMVGASFPMSIKANAVGNHRRFSQWYQNSLYHQQLENAINSITGDQRNDILKIAESQLGYTEGDRKSDLDGTSNQDRKHPNINYTEYNYWYWGVYGGKDYAWCAAFVSWCARQANIPTSIIPNIAYVPNYFNNKAFTVKKTNYIPRPGDIFLTKDQGHVGLVLSVDKYAGTIQTIEGNSDRNGSYEGWAVVSRQKSISSFYYAVPKYTNNVSYATCMIATISGSSISYPIWLYSGHRFEFKGGISSTLPITSACIIIEKRKNYASKEYVILPQYTIVKDFRKPYQLIGDKKTILISKEFAELDTSTLPVGDYRIRIGVSCGLSKLKLYNRNSLLNSNPSDAFVMLCDRTFKVKSRTANTYSLRAVTTDQCSYATIDKIVLTEGSISETSSGSSNSYYNGTSSYPVGTYKITAKSGLNTRSKPTANSTKLSGWSYGSNVDVTATNGNWGYTSRGWICLDYAEFVSGSTSSYNSNVNYDTGNYVVTTPAGLNCRRGVGTNYGVIKALPRGTRFSVTKTDGAWGYSPEYGGWLCLQYTSYESALTPSLPVPELPNLSTTTSSEIGVNEVISFKWDAVDTADTYNVKLIDANTNAEVQSTTVSGTNASFKAPYEGKFNISVSASNSQHTGPAATLYGFYVKGPSTVTFKDWDGKVISTQSVVYGKDATAPATPSRVGYTFTKWDGDFKEVREDRTITAIYTRNKYKVTFCDYDGTVIGTQDVYHGDAAVVPSYKAPTGYSFVKWDTSFNNITKATTVKAVISWTSIYPLEISTSSAVQRNNKSYIVTSIVNNSPNAVNNARIIAVLKTKENKLLATVQSKNISLAKGEVKNLTLTASYEGMATKAEIFVVKADNENIPLSKHLERNVDQGTAWSSWSTSKPPSDAIQTQSRTEYRYRDKQFTTSTSSSLSGWTLRTDVTNPTVSYGSWSAWSAWQDGWIGSSDTVDVGTQSVDDYSKPITETRYSYKTVYNYYRYANINADTGGKGSYVYSSSYPYYRTYKLDNKLTEYDNNYAKTRYHYWYSSSNWVGVYACDPLTTQEVSGSWQETVGYKKKTQYRKRTRTKTVTYYFWKWGNWSRWSPTAVSGTNNRAVETRTTYRYLANTASNIETTQGNYVERNGTVAKSYAGRQALLFVTDKNGAAQFVGQCVIGTNGAYAFKFKTKDEPTAAGGDFTVMLSIEGTSAAFALDPIKAPVPEYNVKFVDYDGTVVSEQTVKQGESASVPAPISREGYRFIGWDKSFTNIQANITLTAQYEIKVFDVVFVDEINNTSVSAKYNYGETLVPPEVTLNDAYNFLGWDAVIDGNTKVTDNMVITAKFKKKIFTVDFLDFDGSVLESQKVEYGEPAVFPELNSRDNYVFISWNSPGDTTYVTESMTIQPYFEYKDTVATPTASIETGTYNGEQTVTLSCETKGAQIYYTTDGSDPLEEVTNARARSVQRNGVLYTGPFTLDSSSQLLFTAVKDGMNSSDYDFKTLAINTANTEKKQYTVTIHYGVFDAENTVLVNDGEPVELLEEEFYGSGYTLEGVYTDAEYKNVWNLETDTVKGEMDLYLKWSKNNYTVTFKDMNGNVIDTQEVAFGEDATAPMWNEVDGYIFTGWDKSYTSVVEDIIVTATYIPKTDVTAVEFNKDSLSLTEGQVETISATVKLGTDCTNNALIWQSSDEDIAIVDDNGKLTAVSAGTATIFAVSEDSGMSAQCEVKVEYKDPCLNGNHTYKQETVEPTCTKDGLVITKCSLCGDIKDTEVIPATGHSDADKDGKCDACGEHLANASNCSCNCHKKGFAGFIYKIMRFFWKLFRINKVCACGQAHY